MTLALLVLLAFAAVGGALLYKARRDAIERAARRESLRLPPFVSTHWKDREQRQEWRRLTAQEQAQVVASVHKRSDWGESVG